MKYVAFIIIGSIMLVIFILINGTKTVQKSDDYHKIFAEKQHSLIIGTSRAARLNTNLISKELNTNEYHNQIYNFAFNLKTSPFGPSYNKSIYNHVNFKSSKRGLFVICIDPWALAVKKSNQKETTFFPENSAHINFNPYQKFASTKYFFETYSKPYYTLFLPEKKFIEIENEVGLDPKFMSNHKKAKMASYRREHFEKEKLSNRRIASLKALVDSLSSKGKIFFVRLPVSQEMIELEHNFSPNFVLKVDAIISQNDIELIDFYKYADAFLCPDGNHLWAPDADKVSLIIADIINLAEKGLLNKNKENLIDAYLNNEQSKYSDILSLSSTDNSNSAH